MQCDDLFLKFAVDTFYIKKRINERIGKEFFLAPIEVEILTFIYMFDDEVTATDIERARKIKKNTISVHVENLVQLGLIERHEFVDRRKIKLVLTDKATTIAKKCASELESINERLKEGLSEEDKNAIIHCLTVVGANATKLLKEGV